MKDTNFFKVPKKLIRSKEYKDLPLTVKILLFNLLSLYNTFGNKIFYQTFKKLTDETNLSRTTIWRSKKYLKNIGVKLTRSGKKYEFDLNLFYHKYIDKKSKNF